MKTAIIFALALATPASADQLPPTDPLIGQWCEPHAPEDKGLFTRGGGKGTSCDDFIISRDSLSGTEETCEFLEIKRIKNGVEIFEECISNHPGHHRVHYEKATYQLIGKRLKYSTTTVREVKAKPIDTGDTHRTTCLEVQPTPDGYLNVRQGPKMSFKIIGKLLPGQRIKADYETDEWIHLSSRCDSGDNISGWVYKKYIEYNDSEEEAILPPPKLPVVNEAPLQKAPSGVIPGATVLPGAVATPGMCQGGLVLVGQYCKRIDEKMLPTLREGIVCEPILGRPNVIDCHTADTHTTHGMPKWLLDR